MTVTNPRTRPVAALRATALPVAVALTGVLAGTVLAAWLTEVSIGGSSRLWISYHQATASTYSPLVPALGAAALVATGVTAATGRSRRERRLGFGAVGCLVVGFVVTVVVHFPMNAEILTWQAGDAPAHWLQVRDRWLAAHVVRATLAVAGFALLLLARPAAPTSRRPR